MRTSRSSRALLAAFAALGGFLSFANAQSVATVPVGAVSISVKANSDQRFGVSLQRPALYTAAASAVSGSSITVTGSISSLGSEAKYVKFSSGALAGQWFTLTSSTGSSVSVAENLQSLGALAGDKFEVVPFWTLNTLFPNGAGLPVSTDAFGPVAYVLLNNPAASGVNIAPSSFYFYHSGATDGIDAGWLDNADPFAGAVPNVIIPPETSVIIRNGTASLGSLVTVGRVPALTSNSVVARVGGGQDSLIYNPYPASLTLGNSGLGKATGESPVKPSTDFFDPSEFVLFYNNSASGLNGAPTAFYFYFIGDVDFPRGWYDNATGELADSVAIPAGAAITVRKRAAASFSEIVWTPSLPYAL